MTMFMFVQDCGNYNYLKEISNEKNDEIDVEKYDSSIPAANEFQDGVEWKAKLSDYEFYGFYNPRMELLMNNVVTTALPKDKDVLPTVTSSKATTTTKQAKITTTTKKKVVTQKNLL